MRSACKLEDSNLKSNSFESIFTNIHDNVNGSKLRSYFLSFKFFLPFLTDRLVINNKIEKIILTRKKIKKRIRKIKEVNFDIL